MYKQNKDGYFRTSVSVKDSKGESRRIFLRAKTEAELIRLKHEAEFQIERGEICFNANTPFKKYAEEWLEVYKKNSVSEKTYTLYESNLTLHIYPTIGNIALKSITSMHCQKILNNNAGKSFSLLNKIKNTLQQVFEQAIEDDYITKNPARKLTLPEHTKGTHRPITEYERKHILKVAEWHRGGLWVLVMLYCGLRPSEAIALNWADIDYKNNLINVNKTMQNPNKTKTPAGKRKVPMPQILADKLKAEQAKSSNIFIFHQKLDTTKPHTPTSIRSMWNNFKRELDISMGAKVFNNEIIISVVADDLTPYCLRHTCATDYQTAGVPINIAKVLLGHEDISVTGNIYTDYTETQEIQTKETLNSFWKCAKDVPNDKKEVANP